jgi:FixJ family two-component response regulator
VERSSHICAIDTLPEDRLANAKLISIVDDDASVRAALKALMKSLGYSVETFPSAIEFLASPSLRDTSCVIADVHMPTMSGIELHRRLTSSGHSIPTILITAYTDTIVRSRALQAGVFCYLSKPFDDDTLASYVQSALEQGSPPRPSS